ncbi:MAG: DUF2339 domain-containing protein [Bacteroidota bacterium]
MEGFLIFLSIVTILLLVIFNASKNSRITLLERKISNIEEYLKKIQFLQSQQTVSQKTEKVAEQVSKPVEPIIPPVIKTPVEPIIPPVINKPLEPVVNVNDIKQQPVQETNKQPEIQITQSVQQKPVKSVVVKEGWYDGFRKKNPDLEKFIGENILSKVAITVLVIGIAFFVKYAIDKEWINEIARVGIGILCGGIVLGFAHKLHKKFKAFSSVLVAGGIAIFYFTIGIAFHEYQLFNQTTAFIIMLLITAFSVFISVLYDRVELAALSLIGGFATPFMVSTGGGNYVVLFVYVLVLDLGMLALAYLRKWNLINVMAYVFTMILYVAWLQRDVIGGVNPPYKGAMIFAAIFYVVFVLMNIIHNIKENQKFGVLDLSILISNTFLFYGVGMQILSYAHPDLKGLFSLLMALFNLGCSWMLYKKFKSDTKLVYLMIGLTLTFVTLIAPVQLQGNYITIFWALEAVLLIWLAQKSGIVLYRFASAIISILMCFSLFMDWTSVYTSYSETRVDVILNKGFITGLVSAFALLVISLLLQRETQPVKYVGISFNPTMYKKLMGIGFIVLLYFTGLFELGYQLDETIFYGKSIPIIMSAYHLVYFSLLNLAVNKLNSTGATVTMYIFNFINACLFILLFAVLPLTDFKKTVMAGYDIQVGFIFHYISILCFGFIIFQMHKAIHKPGSTVKYSKALNTTLLSIALVYLTSSELILHISKLALPENIATLEYGVKRELYDISTIHIIKIGFPILWGVLAFLFLFIGMKRANKTLRVLALLLIGITLIKLFTYDIKDASEAGKIIAFIILGVVLLIISFMYQKIKALLLDDEKKAEQTIRPE